MVVERKPKVYRTRPQSLKQSQRQLLRQRQGIKGRRVEKVVTSQRLIQRVKEKAKVLKIRRMTNPSQRLTQRAVAKPLCHVSSGPRALATGEIIVRFLINRKPNQQQSQRRLRRQMQRQQLQSLLQQVVLRVHQPFARVEIFVRPFFASLHRFLLRFPTGVASDATLWNAHPSSSSLGAPALLHQDPHALIAQSKARASSHDVVQRCTHSISSIKFETGNGSYAADTCVAMNGSSFGHANFSLMEDKSYRRETRSFGSQGNCLSFVKMLIVYSCLLIQQRFTLHPV